jgi:hypothetical protein
MALTKIQEIEQKILIAQKNFRESIALDSKYHWADEILLLEMELEEMLDKESSHEEIRIP